MSKSFKLVNVNENGTYHGARPIQAASKAFTKYCQQNGKEECELAFTIKEITRGSNNKEYSYIGKRIKLDVPKTVTRGTKTFEIKYINNVKKRK